MNIIIKIKSKGYFILLGTIIHFILYSQNYDDSSKPEEWLRKYWFFKSRLNNDFVKVGRGPGESLVFNQRGVYLNSFNPNDEVRFKIGDGTSTLGYYIAMLALEYHLLTIKNQKTDSTLYELACAIDAINRLDMCAEKILTDSSGTGGNGVLNGFFVRDDVYENFVQDNYEHFNYFSSGINNNNQSRGFASKFQKGVNGLFKATYSDGSVEYGSSYQSLFYDKNNNIKASFISQDQVYALLYGLAFVRKFVPENILFKDRQGNLTYFRDGETSISKAAKNIIKRIVDNIRNPKKLDGSGCGGLDWRIARPDNCNSSSLLGHDPWSYPLAEAECILDHKYFGDADIWSVLAPSKCTNPDQLSAQYHTWYSLTIGYDVWWGLTISLSPFGISQPNTNIMLDDIAAACNCIYLTPIPAVFLNNPFPIIIPVPIKYINRTSERIDKLSSIGNYYWYLFHAPLARYLLHGGELKINNEGGQKWRNRPRFLLNEMNPCDHFNLGGNANYSSLGWSTDTRLDHPERIGNNGFRGEYPSIDFLLYHNLWIRSYPGDMPLLYTNLSHYYINSSNLNNGGLGYYNPPTTWQVNKNNYKIQIDAYETIFIEKTKMPFYTNGNYMRAGKEIIIKATNTPGDGTETVIKPGIVINQVSDGTSSHIDDAGIRFYIKKYDCALDRGNFDPNIDDSYEYQSFIISDTSSTGIINKQLLSKNDSIVKNPIPHFIEYSDEPLDVISHPSIYDLDASVSLRTNFLHISPNPVTNKIKVSLSDNLPFSQLEIVTILGDVVEKINLNGQTAVEIDVHSLSPGLYFVRLISDNKLIASSKFVKQ